MGGGLPSPSHHFSLCIIENTPMISYLVPFAETSLLGSDPCGACCGLLFMVGLILFGWAIVSGKG